MIFSWIMKMLMSLTCSVLTAEGEEVKEEEDSHVVSRDITLVYMSWIYTGHSDDCL